MDPLATADDLLVGLALDRWETTEDEAQAEQAVINASAELRAIVGNPISQAVTTVRLWPDDPGRLTLPGQPIISVSAVVVDGTALEPGTWRRRWNTLSIPGVTRESEVLVTYLRGWDPIPDEIKKWTLVLAAAERSAVEAMGAPGMVAGIGQYNEAIEDISLTWTTSQKGDGLGGLTLPQAIQDRLRSSYGDGSGGVEWLEIG